MCHIILTTLIAAQGDLPMLVTLFNDATPIRFKKKGRSLTLNMYHRAFLYVSYYCIYLNCCFAYFEHQSGVEEMIIWRKLWWWCHESAGLSLTILGGWTRGYRIHALVISVVAGADTATLERLTSARRVLCTLSCCLHRVSHLQFTCCTKNV